MIFGSTITGASLADDLQKGLIDRFRSLPMAHSAVLVGRTAADLALNALSIAVMAADRAAGGLADPHLVRARRSAGFLVLLGFAYAMSWLMAQVGLMVRTPEVVQNASFIVIFPITFVANTFVPLETFPPVLQTFAEWNPVSSVVQAARNLFGNSFGAPGRVVAAEPGALLGALGGRDPGWCSSRCRCARSGTPRAGDARRRSPTPLRGVVRAPGVLQNPGARTTPGSARMDGDERRRHRLRVP